MPEADLRRPDPQKSRQDRSPAEDRPTATRSPPSAGAQEADCARRANGRPGDAASLRRIGHHQEVRAATMAEGLASFAPALHPLRFHSFWGGEKTLGSPSRPVPRTPRL